MDTRRYTIVAELGDYALAKAVLLTSIALLAVAVGMVAVYAVRARRAGDRGQDTATAPTTTIPVEPTKPRAPGVAVFLTVLVAAALLGSSEPLFRHEPTTAESAAQIREEIATAWPLATVELPGDDEKIVAGGSWPARLNSMDCRLIADRRKSLWTGRLLCQDEIEVPVAEPGTST